MKKELVADIIEWDITNWSKSLSYWSQHVDIKNAPKYCLELGGRRGGLSLWLALNKHRVICSDLESPQKDAYKLHSKYSCADKITYQAIDATNIPYSHQFDLVVFKSILGGISRDGNIRLKKKTIDEIHKSLKPNGQLLFAENLAASFLHKFFRKNFVSWGKSWNYLKFEEIEEIFCSFEKLQFITVGFLGAFGRTPWQKRILSHVDSVLEPMIPPSKKYIVIGIATKKGS